MVRSSGRSAEKRRCAPARAFVNQPGQNNSTPISNGFKNILKTTINSPSPGVFPSRSSDIPCIVCIHISYTWFFTPESRKSERLRRPILEKIIIGKTGGRATIRTQRVRDRFLTRTVENVFVMKPYRGLWTQDRH